MAELVVLVLNDPEKTDEVLEAWVRAGVSGATILNSTGLTHHMPYYGARDDLPLIPSLSSLLRSQEKAHRTLFVLVPDDFNVDALIAATEKAIGRLEEPHTGILFVLPVSRVVGRAFNN
jgi:nitrogen regulatory protein P-II 1